MALDPKDHKTQVFIEAVVATANSTHAARLAGFEDAKNDANRLAQNKDVQETVKARRSKILEKMGITTEAVMQHVKDLAFANPVCHGEKDLTYVAEMRIKSDMLKLLTKIVLKDDDNEEISEIGKKIPSMTYEKFVAVFNRDPFAPFQISKRLPDVPVDFEKLEPVTLKDPFKPNG